MTEAELTRAADRMAETITPHVVEIYADGMAEALEREANGADPDEVERAMELAETAMMWFVDEVLDGWENDIKNVAIREAMEQWEREGGGDEGG